jgi:hypothetical protein
MSSSYSLTCSTMFYKSLKFHHYMFRPMWSSSGFKSYGWGSCCLPLLPMLLNIRRYPRCACVFELVGCVPSCCVFRCESCSQNCLETESDLHCDWRFTANQFVLAPSFLTLTNRVSFFFFASEPLRSFSLCNILSDEKMSLSPMNVLSFYQVYVSHI